MLAVYLAVRWYVARIGLPPEEISPVDNPIVEASLWTGRLTALKVMVSQLWLVLWPRSLSADYSYRQIPLVAWPPACAGDWGALLAGSTVATVPVLLAFAIFQRQIVEGLLQGSGR